MTMYRVLTVFGVMVLTTACNTPKHSDARVQMQGRWDHVRGRVRYQLAEQQHDAGLFEEAVQTVAESITLDPSQPDAYVLLARANLELGKLASAQRAVDSAGQAGLVSADLHYVEGVILEQRHHLDTAAQRYAQALAMDPHNVDYLVAEAECLVALNRPQEALNLLNEHIDDVDDEGTVAVLAAHVAALVGDVDQASRRFEQALLAERDSRLIAEELGRLLAEARRYEAALSILTPLLQSAPDEVDQGAVRRAVATCHLALGDPVAARTVLEEYAPAHPEDTMAQLQLAKAAVATDEVLTALRAVDRAAERAPHLPELWLVRATVQWKRGRPAAAAADLYDVIQNDPDDVEAHCLLGEVLRDQQRRAGAEAHFQRALEIDPGCAWATAGLEALRHDRLRPQERSSKLTSAKAGSPTGPD